MSMSPADSAAGSAVSVPVPGATYTTEQLAAMHHAAPSTARQWRRAGTGPRYFMAGKRVLYRGEDILAWQTAGGTHKLDNSDQR